MISFLLLWLGCCGCGCDRPEVLQVAPEPVPVVQRAGALETLSTIRSLRQWAKEKEHRQYVVTFSDSYTKVYLVETSDGRIQELQRSAATLEEAITKALESWK